MKENIELLVIDSLFFAMKMNGLTKAAFDNSDKNANRLLSITTKAWYRHWRRIQKAIDNGNIVLTIPQKAREQFGL